MRTKPFGSLLTAMITPFDNEGNIHKCEVKRIVDYLLEHGTDTLVVAGTTGESPTLSNEEKVMLFDLVKKHVGDRAKVVAGTGCNDTNKTLALSKAAEEVGVDGVMVVVPYYNKPPQEALFAHFSYIANHIHIPVMIYNVPGRTACNILPETVAKLAEIKNIVAIKEASGQLDQVSKIVSLCNNKLAVYSGDDSLTLPILAVGGCGIVSVASHLVGKEIKKMISAFDNGQPHVATQLHCQMFELIKSLFMTTNPIPVKTAMELLGFDTGGFRMPLIAMDEQMLSKLRECMHRYHLI